MAIVGSDSCLLPEKPLSQEDRGEIWEDPGAEGWQRGRGNTIGIRVLKSAGIEERCLRGGGSERKRADTGLARAESGFWLGIRGCLGRRPAVSGARPRTGRVLSLDGRGYSEATGGRGRPMGGVADSAGCPQPGLPGPRGALPRVTGRGRRPRSRSQSREAGRSGCGPNSPQPPP